jgi:hypothetical protein
MAANGPTKQVCGMKHTSTSVELGYLQCFDSETCKQFVEMKYSLHENILEQNFTVYYLKHSIRGDIVLKPNEECPKIEESMYKSKETFSLMYTKQ